MANQRREPVSYQPFRTRAILAEGLLPVARDGGEFMERVASAMFRMADEAGVVADRKAEAQGRRAGQQAALDGRPQGDLPPIGGNGKARGASFSGPLNQAIETAASKHGVDAATLKTIAQIESGGNPRAKNPRSSAGGPFQFIDSTAKAMGLADRFDIDQSSDAAARLMKNNAGHLRKVLGRDPTPGELYLAHQQGAGGAARLLANPDAKASSIVGADAVRLNGGKAGMSAGQFASLWINKAENGYVLPSEPDQISPGVTLTGGTYRPSGRDTVFGRAYDEAGTRTYVQLLETEMRSTSSQLFDRYKDDPVKLAEAFNDLKGVIAKEHVFPEIMADFDVGFGNMAERYVSQARDNLTKKVEAQDRADFIERTSTLETDQAKRLADFDPSTPDAADAIAASQAAIDDHYDAAVDRKILDPADAARAKIASRREAALGFYGKQAEALDADGVATMRKEMAADFADGEIEGLDGDGWQTLDRGLQQLETNKRNEAKRATNDYRQRGDQMAARLAAGYEIDQAELSKLMLDSGTTPEGKTSLQETFAKISAGRAIRDLGVKQSEAHVAGLRKQYGATPSDGELRILSFAEGMLEKKKRAIATDAVSYAEAQGIIPATPMLTDAQTAEDMQSTMSSRVSAADEAAEQLGVPARYLKAGEAKAMAAAVKADPVGGASIAAAVVAGAGDRAAAVLSEFGNDAPMIAESGAIIAFGGSATAAQDVIKGYGKGADGKALKGLKPDVERESARTVTGTALAYAPGDASRISRAASAIARTRIAEQNLDPTSDEALAVHQQAVQEAAGAVFDRGEQFGGFADFGGGTFTSGRKVLVPSAIRADLFEDVVGAISEQDLAALAVKPKAGIGFFGSGKGGAGRAPRGLAWTLRGAVPVAVDGGFAFAMGDPGSEDPQFIQGDNGKVFVLDIMALRDRLAPRVPGAFR